MLEGLMRHLTEVPRHDLPSLRHITLYLDKVGPEQVRDEELDTFQRFRGMKEQFRSHSTLVENAKGCGLGVDIYCTPGGAYQNTLIELAHKDYPATGNHEKQYDSVPWCTLSALKSRGLLERSREEAHEAHRVDRLAILEDRKLRLRNGSIDDSSNVTAQATLEKCSHTAQWRGLLGHIAIRRDR
jgi:hypothetical protein